MRMRAKTKVGSSGERKLAAAADPARECGMLKRIGGSQSDQWNDRIGAETVPAVRRLDRETREQRFDAVAEAKSAKQPCEAAPAPAFAESAKQPCAISSAPAQAKSVKQPCEAAPAPAPAESAKQPCEAAPSPAVRRIRKTTLRGRNRAGARQIRKTTLGNAGDVSAGAAWAAMRPRAPASVTWLE
jgi:hypothetical protein